jgi:hypothetical protein
VFDLLNQSLFWNLCCHTKYGGASSCQSCKECIRYFEVPIIHQEERSHTNFPCFPCQKRSRSLPPSLKASTARSESYIVHDQIRNLVAEPPRPSSSSRRFLAAIFLNPPSAISAFSALPLPSNPLAVVVRLALDLAMLIRVLLLALIHFWGGVGRLGLGISVALVVVAVLLAPEVDVLGVTLGVFTDEEGNDLFDQPFHLSGLVVASAEVDFCHGFCDVDVVAGAVAGFEGSGEGMRGWLLDVSGGR